MQRSGRRLWAVIATVLGFGVAPALAVPFLVLGVGGIDRSSGEACAQPAAGDLVPTILGSPQLTAASIEAWWSSTRRSQPAGLDVEIEDLIRLYLAEGESEGVRGDLAFVQATIETGFFTSTDTGINNFAGIAHPDGAAAGRAFPSVQVGVRAHIQLLKKFAAGNDVSLAAPDVAPTAGARATTWADLAGTWASDPQYWASLSRLYDEIRGSSSGGRATQNESAPCTQAPPSRPASVVTGPLSLTTVRGITVNTAIGDQVERLLAAAEADGLLLNGHGYRSNAQQIALRRSHCGTSNYAIYEMPAGQCSPPTARPGTSMHERGLAIDFVNCSTRSTRCYQWLAANAAEFGLFNLPSEPWHFSTTGG